jgi:prophage maintenance system killer protein
MQNRLSLDRLLLIAEATLGVPYEELKEAICVFRAEAALAAPFLRVCGVYLFPDPVEQAAICATRLILTRPLPFGNRAVGYECMREMLVLSGCRWFRQAEEVEEVDETLRRVEAGDMDQAEFIDWVRMRVAVR